jgi:hypothetical protein
MSHAVTDELIELRGLRFHYRDWPSISAAMARPPGRRPTSTASTT